MKILTILGARPQFVKAGAVSRAIKQVNSRRIKEVIVHTGQHYDKNMSDVFFKELHLPKPDYSLGVNGLNHGAMTGQMMEKIEEVALKEKPDVIMVYGDTNSTLAGALVGAKLHIPIAHVEAGLRSHNMQMPEEINRAVTDRISKWLFCPTETAVKNLKREGYPFTYFYGENQIIENVGDVMYDAVMYYKQFAKPPTHLPIGSSTHTLIYPSTHSPFILCTIHRAENTDNPERLKNIFEALEEIAKEIPVIVPLHPRTRKKLQNLHILDISSHFPINPSTHSLIHSLTIIDPVGYLEMIWLLDNCKMVITDSGGLQKEAFFFKKPCVTLREETEWMELVDIGANVLVGADKESIVKVACESEKVVEKLYSSLSQNALTNLYGDGKASERIVNELKL